MLAFDPRAASLLSEQGLGVLSTIGRDGIVHGAVIHCLLEDDGSIYFMTKSQTQKIHDTLANPRVALTVYDHEKMQTAQIQGIAQIEADQTIKNYVFSHLSKARQYGSSKHLPPVTQLKEGSSRKAALLSSRLPRPQLNIRTTSNAKPLPRPTDSTGWPAGLY